MEYIGNAESYNSRAMLSWAKTNWRVALSVEFVEFSLCIYIFQAVRRARAVNT